MLSAQALCFDDREFVSDNVLVRNPSWAAARRFVVEVAHPSTVHGYYLPLTMISLMLDSAAGGRPSDLRQFHRTNLALHLLTTAALIVLLHLFTGQPAVSLLLGLLYGVHPLTVEPIAWIGERKTVLATAMVMGSLVSYVLHVTRRHRGYLVLSLGSFALSILAKPTTVPLPVLLLLLDYWPLNRLSRRSVWEKAPYFLLAAVGAVVTVVSNANTAKVSLPGGDAPLPVLLKVGHNIGFYAWKMVWPAGLTPYYPPPEPFALSHPSVAAGIIGTAVLIAAMILSWRWTRVWIAGGTFFLVALLPTLGIIGFSWILASDKYLYFPAVGLAIPGSWYAYRLWRGSPGSPPSKGRRGALVAIGLVVATCLSLSTRRQLTRWETSEGLYRYMLTLAPTAPVVHYSLAGVLVDHGDIEEADAHYEEALRESPDYGDAHVGLSRVRYTQGRWAEAAEHCRVALRLNPNSADAHNNLGSVLDVLGQFDEAVHHMREAIRIHPEFTAAYYNLGLSYMRQDRTPEAIEQYRAALRLSPSFLEAQANLAAALEKQGDFDGAVHHYREALKIAPNDPVIQRRLAEALRKQAHPAAGN